MADSSDSSYWGPPPEPGGPDQPPQSTGPLPYLPEQGAGRKRRSPAALAGLVVGIVALVGGAVFAATQLAGDDNTPEDAVAQLFEAVGNEDVLGVLESLLPSERDSFRQPVIDLTDELKRLEILSGDVNLSKLSGVDASFEGLRFSSQAIAGDLAAVRVEGGTVRTSADPSKLPLGEFVRGIAGGALEEAGPTTDEEPLAFDAEDDPIVTVKDGGRWYVSLWYSVAEAARREAGASLPDFDAVVAKGAETPEAAIDQFLRALAGLELRRLLELLPPDEARALHDYAPLFLAEAEEGVRRVGEVVDVEIGVLRLAAKADGDQALVTVEEMAFDAASQEFGFQLSYRDGCATFSGPDQQEQRICPGDPGQGLEDVLRRFLGPNAPSLDIAKPELGFSVVRRDGQWYVSPTRTVIDGLTAMLRALDRDDLDAIRGIVEGFATGFGGFATEEEQGGFTIPAGPGEQRSIGGYTPEEFGRLSPEEQRKALEEQFGQPPATTAP